jgi:hypothetical protein
MTTWREIRAAAVKAGLDVDEWQAGMHDRLLRDVLIRAKSQERYAADPAFRAQLERMLSFVLATFFEHDPLTEDLRPRAADLGQAFRDEIEDVRG